MNRIEHPPQLPEEVLSNSKFGIDEALFTKPAHDSSHALFAPLHYESGYAYPLIVWLHGPGGSERQLMRVMPLVSMRNYLAVAPRGIAMAGGNDAVTYGWEQTPDDIQQAEQRIFDCIAIATRKLHVASHRIFLAGFDGGGTMAFRVAMNRPDLFAGVLSLCGRFPVGYSPLGHLALARRLSIFLAAGRDSRRHPPEEVCKDLRLFHAAGINVTLRQYPCGHELMPQMLRDVDRWIIEQITSAAEVPTETDYC